MSQTTLPVDSAARKEYPLFRGPFRYFPAAIAGVARICKIGNDKHNPGQEMHHARGKSNDHADCVLRHLMDLGEDFGQGVGRDENGVPQVDYLAWRALALAQEWHEQFEGMPLAPGAKLPEVASQQSYVELLTKRTKLNEEIEAVGKWLDANDSSAMAYTPDKAPAGAGTR